MIELREELSIARATRRCGDFRVLPGHRRGTFMRDWRRCGYRNSHRWALAFHLRLEAWRWQREMDHFVEEVARCLAT